MTPKRLLLAAVAGAAVLAAIAVGISPAPRAGAPWDFPVGARVRYHDVDSIGGRTLECDEEWMVVQRDADLVSVDIRRSGPSLPESKETLKIGLRAEPDSLEGAALRGRESLEGLECERWEKSDEDAITRIWTHRDCAWPARVVQEVRATGETVDRRWLRDAAERVRVAAIDLPCERFVEIRHARGRVVEETQLWLNAAVPGHVVRRIRVMTDAAGEARFRSEATGFGSRNE